MTEFCTNWSKIEQQLDSVCIMDAFPYCAHSESDHYRQFSVEVPIYVTFHSFETVAANNSRATDCATAERSHQNIKQVPRISNRSYKLEKQYGAALHWVYAFTQRAQLPVLKRGLAVVQLFAFYFQHIATLQRMRRE